MYHARKILENLMTKHQEMNNDLKRVLLILDNIERIQEEQSEKEETNLPSKSEEIVKHNIKQVRTLYNLRESKSDLYESLLKKHAQYHGVDIQVMQAAVNYWPIREKRLSGNKEAL